MPLSIARAGAIRPWRPRVRAPIGGRPLSIARAGAIRPRSLRIRAPIGGPRDATELVTLITSRAAGWPGKGIGEAVDGPEETVCFRGRDVVRQPMDRAIPWGGEATPCLLPAMRPWLGVVSFASRDVSAYHVLHPRECGQRNEHEGGKGIHHVQCQPEEATECQRRAVEASVDVVETCGAIRVET